MKRIAKNCLRVVFLALALPLAAIAGFGRFLPTFSPAAHACARVPGVVGNYIRNAFLKLTLKRCSLYGRVSFRLFVAHPNVVLGREVYIGSYCILGCTRSEIRHKSLANSDPKRGNCQAKSEGTFAGGF